MGEFVEELSVYHLFGNTVHERTIIGIRCSSCGSGQIPNGIPHMFSEEDKENKWSSSLLSLQTWVDSNNGRLPMRHARDKQERELATWMFKQRKQHSRNASLPTILLKASCLEKYSWWSWTTEEEDFLNALAMLQEWVAANDGLPDQIVKEKELPSQQDNQRVFLSSWMMAQRHRRIMKAMDAEHETMLNACPHWSWEFDWSNKEGACTFLSGASANRSATVDRMLGPQFQCSRGFFYFRRDQMTSCSEKHVVTPS